MNPDRIERQQALGAWLSENCWKPRNSLNNVSFAELMRQLRGDK